MTFARVGAFPNFRRSRVVWVGVSPFRTAARAIAFSAAQQASQLTVFDSVPGTPGTPYRRLHAATLGGR